MNNVFSLRTFSSIFKSLKIATIGRPLPNAFRRKANLYGGTGRCAARMRTAASDKLGASARPDRQIKLCEPLRP